ncbi:cellulase family glycosylhydrolase [Lachnospira sp.]|uniref:cellulase family glycosylhydrolase n=1 Tax=Lachnospira sp. TaxID=2049031 RepID=UPI00257CD3DF|nr:cellulase family glycosylhydrolase [Lachnospira sp.]
MSRKKGILTVLLALVLVFVSLDFGFCYKKVLADNDATVSIDKSNSWESNGEYFAQFNITITNNSSKRLTDWQLKLDKGSFSLSQSWCCSITDCGSYWQISPESYNQVIEASMSISNVGLILSSSGETSLGNVTIVTSYETTSSTNPTSSSNESNNTTNTTATDSTSDSNGSITNAANEQLSEPVAEENQEGELLDCGKCALIGAELHFPYANGALASAKTAIDYSNESKELVAKERESTEATTNEEEVTTGVVALEDTKSADSAVTNNEETANSGDNSQITYGSARIPTGRVRVSGSHLVDSSGSQVQLRGVSTHGISWFPEYLNSAALSTLKNDWGINVIRIAMYPKEYAGYLSGGDKESLKSKIDEGVKAAANLGLYVIIDWHVLNYNPNETNDEAIDFFKEMSSKYKDYENVIYEICNEPVGAEWSSQIKPYAESVISAIRENDSQALIIVGTNTWSQDVDAVVGNTIDDANVCYSLHFYAATHKEAIQNKLKYAINNGVPVFVSECSICDASGSGGIDYTWANSWLNLLNENNISYIAWSLCNKQETSALIKSSCSKTSGWSEDDYSDAGKWFMKAIKNQ